MSADGQKSKKKKTQRPGLFAALCDRLGSCFGRSASSAFIGGFRVLERCRSDSFVSRFLSERRGDRLRLRVKVASMMEASFFLNARSSLLRMFVEIPAKGYPVFLLVYAALSSGLRLLRCFLENSLIPSEILGASSMTLILAAAAFPLFFSEKSLSELFFGSRFFNRVLTSWMDIPPEKLAKRREGKTTVPLAVLFGIFLGSLSWFATPDTLLTVPLLLIFLSVLADYPRSGVILLLLLTPFLSVFTRPSLLLGIMLCSCAVGWAAKLIRGRRSLYFDSVDIPVILLAADLLLSGFAGGAAYSWRSALMRTALTAGYFLCLNLVRSRDSLYRAAAALALSGAAVSMTGIGEFISGAAPLDWIDQVSFPLISGRSAALFDNPNMLASFLALCFPAALFFAVEGRGRVRIAGFAAAASISVCSVMTFSRSGWIGLAAGAFAFLIFRSPRGIISIPLAAGGIAAAAYLLPFSFGSRLSRFFSLSDTANRYRVRVWNGSVRALGDLFLTGTGSGDVAFRNVYVIYSHPGTWQTPHSHSLWLQTALQLGLPGLILFVAAALLLFMKAVTASREGKRAGSAGVSSLCAAFFAGALSLLASGVFDFTLYNYRVFFIFCCVAGLASAAADACTDAAERFDLSADPELF